MNILAIMGSPRGMKGNTGRLLDEVLAGVEKEGGDAELINLSKSKVQPCVSCEACHRTGECSIKDDYAAIKSKLLASDGFILASPNYITSVTAQMKALFDRCTNLIHCLSMEGKYAAAVETSGGGEDAEVIRYMERFINIVGAQSVGGIGSPMAGVRTFPDEEALFAKARELGKTLCRSIREKRHFPAQDAFRDAFKERMKRLVAYREKDWPSEFEFWQARSR
jgi:multimeric flavodoxin WrbA